ncbi:hypothetical protein ACFX2G_040231 [Malus domestica]
MYLMATSSLVYLSVISLATLKFLDPISETKSYRSLSCMIGISMAGPTVIACRSISMKSRVCPSTRADHIRERRIGKVNDVVLSFRF